jgi:hypothetical protein
LIRLSSEKIINNAISNAASFVNVSKAIVPMRIICKKVNLLYNLARQRKKAIIEMYKLGE